LFKWEEECVWEACQLCDDANNNFIHRSSM
jgi:hypothetical protein